MTDEGERLAVLEALLRCERALATHPSWQAWQALDAQIANHTGPDAKTVGALVGGYAMDLATEPAYRALLAARIRLGTLDAGEATKPKIPTETEPAPAPPVPVAAPEHDDKPTAPVLPVIPPPPPPAGPKSKPLALSDVAPLPVTVPVRPAKPPARSSLLDRIAELEREATSLVAPPRAAPAFGVEEAEVIIETEDELPDQQPGSGLVSRLEELANRPAQPSHRAGATVAAVDEAEVEIVIEDDETDRR